MALSGVGFRGALPYSYDRLLHSTAAAYLIKSLKPFVAPPQKLY